jgi:hypothetical protein
MPVIAETGQENTEKCDTTDDTAENCGNMFLVTVYQGIDNRFFCAIGIASIAREDLVWRFSWTVGRAIELGSVGQWIEDAW